MGFWGGVGGRLFDGWGDGDLRWCIGKGRIDEGWGRSLIL